MKKRILSLALVVVMALCLMSTIAFASGDVYWTFDEGAGLLTIIGNGDMKDYDIEERPWNLVAEDIKTVVVKDGITSICDWAFNGCTNLTKVEIADSVVSIGKFAFRYCTSLSAVKLPRQLEEISDYLFYGCTSLETVSLPSTVTKVGPLAFDGCGMLLVVEYEGGPQQSDSIIVDQYNGPLFDATDIYPSHKFDDVATNKWYERYVNYVSANKLFQGVGNNTFLPTDNITRAQFVQVLANLENVDVTNKNVTTSFTDVPSNKWYTPAVKWASDKGIINGFGDGTFQPTASITREQMCAMLVRYINYKNITVETSGDGSAFADDNKIGKWAKAYVYTCKQANIVIGKGNNIFDPKGLGTRAEAAVIFTRLHRRYLAK